MSKMSWISKGVKTPQTFFYLNPALKDGAIDSLFDTFNMDNYPDIYDGDKNSRLNGIYANLSFPEWTII